MEAGRFDRNGSGVDVLGVTVRIDHHFGIGSPRHEDVARSQAVNGRKPGTASTQPPVAAPGLEVRLLGPLEVSVNGRPVTLTARRLRTLLAVLAMSAGKSVSVDRLAAAVWEADPPDNARRRRDA
jgi:DNA-binding response OmpR family regulator